MAKVIFDVETTTKNKGHPFTQSNKCVAYTIFRDKEKITRYFDDIEFGTGLRTLITDGDYVVGFNIKFDLHWAIRYGLKIPNKLRVWDCQIAQFLIEGQANRYPSLNDALTYHGLGQKKDTIAEYWKLGLNTDEIPKEELLEYVEYDVDRTDQLEQAQRKVMTPEQITLCLVMGIDLLCLLEMEQNGIKLDIEKCNAKREECLGVLSSVTSSLHDAFGCNYINFDSGHHLSAVLFGGSISVDHPSFSDEVYKSGAKKGQSYVKTHHNYVTYNFPGIFKPNEDIKSKQKINIEGLPPIPVYFTNEEVLKTLPARNKLQKDVINWLMILAENAKLIDTYFGALPELINKMEWQDNYIHGSYNQCVAATGRLSSTKPNMQNFSAAVDEVLVSRYE